MQLMEIVAGDFSFPTPSSSNPPKMLQGTFSFLCAISGGGGVPPRCNALQRCAGRAEALAAEFVCIYTYIVPVNPVLLQVVLHYISECQNPLRPSAY